MIVGKGQVDFAAIMEIIVKALIVVLAAAIAQWFTNICNNKMTYNVIRDIRADAFYNIEKIPLSYIDSHSHGDIISRVVNDVDQVGDGLLQGFTQLFTGVVTIVGTLVFMLSISVPMAIVATNTVDKIFFSLFTFIFFLLFLSFYCSGKHAVNQLFLPDDKNRDGRKNDQYYTRDHQRNRL